MKKDLILKAKKNHLFFYLSIIVLPLIQFAIFYIYVNANSIFLAFKKYSYNDSGNLVTQIVWFDNIVEVFKGLVSKDTVYEDIFLISLKNSLLFYAVFFIFGTVIGILFSYYIYKKRFAYKFFKIFLYLPNIISGMVIAIVFRYFIIDCIPEIWQKLFGIDLGEGFPSSELMFGLIIFYNIFIGYGGSVLIYSGTMSGVSDSCIEAAQLDGVNAFQELWHVVLPHIYPTFATLTVAGVATIFTGQLSLFNFYGLEAPKEYYTFGYYIYISVQKAAGDYMYYTGLAAIGVVLTAICIPLTFAVRYCMGKFGPSVD